LEKEIFTVLRVAMSFDLESVRIADESIVLACYNSRTMMAENKTNTID